MSRYTFQNKKFGLDELNKSSRTRKVEGYHVTHLFLKRGHIFEVLKTNFINEVHIVNEGHKGYQCGGLKKGMRDYHSPTNLDPQAQTSMTFVEN